MTGASDTLSMYRITLYTCNSKYHMALVVSTRCVVDMRWIRKRSTKETRTEIPDPTKTTTTAQLGNVSSTLDCTTMFEAMLRLQHM